MPKRSKVSTDFSTVSREKKRRRSKKEQNEQPDGCSCSTSDVLEETLDSGILQGDEVSLYVLELQLAKNAVVVLDTSATMFFLRDFNVKTKSLWDKQFVSLKRKACEFLVESEEGTGEEKEYKWIYHCSCSKSHSDLVVASGPHINMLYEEWLQMHPGCIHVQALRKQMNFFDDIFSISPTLQQEGQVTDGDDEDLTSNIHGTFVEDQPNIIAGNPPSSTWGILSNSTQGMKCLTCRYGNYSCSHCSYVVESIHTEACPDFVIDFFHYCTTPDWQSMSQRGPHYRVRTERFQ